MLGVLVNALAIFAGGMIGLLLKKGIPQSMEKTVLSALGLCTLVIGIKGAFEGENTLVMILSLGIGSIIGSLLDIDGAMNRLGAAVERKLQKDGASGGIAEGFVNGTLLFCVGAMAVMGSLQAGLLGSYETLFAKSLLDMFAAMMLAVSLGVGVGLSAISVLLYEGVIALLAGTLEPLLTPTAIHEITCSGSVMVMAIGVNLVTGTKIKIANLLPGIILAPVLSWLFSLLPI